LDRDQVAESIRALYRTGDYMPSASNFQPDGWGVRVDFVVRETTFFQSSDHSRPGDAATEASSDCRGAASAGTSLPSRRGERGVGTTARAAEGRRAVRAQVSADTVPHTQDHQMDVIITIHAGTTCADQRSAAYEWDGVWKAGNSCAVETKAGGQVTASRVQRATTRVRNFLVEKGALERPSRSAARKLRREKQHHSAGTGGKRQVPLVRITVTGAKFSGGELKNWCQMYQEGAVDTDLLEEGKRNIRERLERNGYSTRVWST